MNQQARQVVYTPVDIDDADFEEYVDPKMAEENAEFEQFKQEMHDAQYDAKITVGKKLTDSAGRPLGRQVFECFECGIDDYTFSQLCTRIREDFGTGLYKIQGRDSKGKYKFNRTIGILAPNQTDNVPAGNDIGALIDKFSDAMQRQQMRTEEMFKSLIGPQHGGDAFDQMTKMMTAMGAMLGALGLNPQQNQPQTLGAQIKEFLLLKELMDGMRGEGGPGGEANIYSVLGDTIRTFGVPIAQAIQAGQDSGHVNPAGVIQHNPAEPVPTPEEIEQKKQDEAMQTQIRILIANAESGTDPKQMAQIVVEHLDEQQADQFYEWISAEDFLERLIALVPEVEKHKNWFTALRDECLELLTEPVDESITGESETVAGESDGSDISDTPNGDTGADT